MALEIQTHEEEGFLRRFLSCDILSLSGPLFKEKCFKSQKTQTLEPLAEGRFLIKSPAYEMLIYEMLIIGVDQARSGSKEDGTEISPWKEKGKRDMHGTCVEQAEQVAQLKRLA